MSLSLLTIKLIGVVLACIGMVLILGAVGVNLGVHASAGSTVVDLILGALLLGAGVVIVRGGTITA